MSKLTRVFKLLNGFEGLALGERSRRLTKVAAALQAASAGQQDALEKISEIGQLQKAHAYMLIRTGQASAGIRELARFGRDCEAKIADLHEEAAFQFAEASSAAFSTGKPAAGFKFAVEALAHSGQARRVSNVVLRALESAQLHQSQAHQKRSLSKPSL